MSSPKVHFFDIESTLSGPRRSWSPNTIRVRMALNYKSIPYTQSHISYPDIAPLLQTLSVPPHVEEDSTPIPYTLPAIYHPSSLSNKKDCKGGALMDSLPIILHLEETFPDTPTLFPTSASLALSQAVHSLVWIAGGKPGRGVLMAMCRAHDILDPRGQEYFHRTRCEWFDVQKVSDAIPTGEKEKEAWEGMILRLKAVADLFGKDMVLHGKQRKGPFIEGDGSRVSFADFEIVAWLAWWERCFREGFERILDEVKTKDGERPFKTLWEACEGWVDGVGEDVQWDVEGGKIKE